MHNKNRSSKVFYRNCSDKFEDYIENDEKKCEYEEIRILYNKIKDSYIEKIKKNEINIKIEKIQLEKRLGKYNGILMDNNINMLYIFVSAFIATLLNITTDIFESRGTIVVILFLFLMGWVILKSIIKTFISDKNEELVYNISLIVLDKLEREKYSE